MRVLAIDGGNTHIDWAIHADGKWSGHDRIANGDDMSAIASCVKSVDRACVCSVGNDSQRKAIEQALEGCKIDWVVAQKRAGGVVNNYRPYSDLGQDRWCALLGLRKKHGHGVAILAGTAVTVDLLSKEGVFDGGIIVPGVDAMRLAIEKTTNIGPLPDGHPSMPPEPSSTKDAVTAGAMHAMAGAIKSYLGKKGLDGREAILCGGYAPILSEMIAGSSVDRNLVFRGMLVAMGI